MNKLEFLNLGKDFVVTKCKGYYKINFIETDEVGLEACIEDKRITYYVTGICNSLSDSAPININRLSKLVNFCNFVLEE